MPILKRIIYGTSKQTRYRGQDYRNFVQLHRIEKPVVEHHYSLRLVEVEVHRRGHGRKTNMEYYVEYASYAGILPIRKFILFIQIPDWFYSPSSTIVVDENAITYLRRDGSYLKYCPSEHHVTLVNQFELEQVHSDYMKGKILEGVKIKSKITTEFFE